jgi:hypothetical protein
LEKQPIYNNWNFWALTWLIVNLLQSYYTQLIDDEAYYWVFSNQLDFGYFDHPPMVALFVKIGYLLFENELGVRLLTVFSQVVFLRIVWSFIQHSNKEKYVWLFFLIAASIPMFQVYGFITTPDVPLLLFGAIVLWTYRAYLKSPSFTNILLFGIAAGALMYSKYHGAFLIIAIILSNLKLLKQYQFYIVGTIALMLFLPHMLWQLEHDFVSFQYHLFDRVKVRSFRFIFENLLNQFLVYNPLLWFIFVPALIFHWKTTIKSNITTPENQFQKTLMVVFLTFSGLCLLFSFRLQRIEPHWTVVFVIPLIVFTFQFLAQSNQQKNLKRFKYIAAITITLFFGARMFFIQGKSLLTGSTYMAKTEIQEFEKLANGKPIIALNNYQYSSLLAFYGKNKTAYGVNSLHGSRNNQYNVWDNTNTLNGESVFFVERGSRSVLQDTIVLSTGKRMFYGSFDDYLNIQNIEFETNEVTNTTYKIGDTIVLNCKLSNPYSYDLPMNRFSAYWSFSKYNVPAQFIGKPKILRGNSMERFKVQFVVPDKVGTFETKWLLGLENYNLLKYVTEPRIINIKE